MTNSVTFSPSVGGDGATYTDDSDPYTGMGNGGHHVRFIPALANIVGVGGFVVGQVAVAQTSANTAVAAASAASLGAANMTGTSTSGLAIGIGAKSLTTQTGKNFYVGQLLRLYNSDSQQMVGYCTAYNSGTGVLSVSVTWKRGTGTVSNWSISICTDLAELNMLLGSSTSSLALGTGSKTLTVEADKGFAAGNLVLLFNDATHQMAGNVTSYNADTGQLVVNVSWTLGTGTLAAWTVTVVQRINDLPTITGVGDAGKVIKVDGTGSVYTLGAAVPAGTAISTPVISGTREAKQALSGTSIDTAAANYFTKTISGATTLSVTNVPSAGTSVSFILDLTNGGSAAITWWAGMKWAGGTAPTLTSSGRDVLGFFTHDGGTTWSGLVLGKDVK